MIVQKQRFKQGYRNQTKETTHPKEPMGKNKSTGPLDKETNPSATSEPSRFAVLRHGMDDNLGQKGMLTSDTYRNSEKGINVMSEAQQNPKEWSKTRREKGEAQKENINPNRGDITNIPRDSKTTDQQGGKGKEPREFNHTTMPITYKLPEALANATKRIDFDEHYPNHPKSATLQGKSNLESNSTMQVDNMALCDPREQDTEMGGQIPMDSQEQALMEVHHEPPDHNHMVIDNGINASYEANEADDTPSNGEGMDLDV